jgi:hypothetical protein
MVLAFDSEGIEGGLRRPLPPRGVTRASKSHSKKV